MKRILFLVILLGVCLVLVSSVAFAATDSIKLNVPIDGMTQVPKPGDYINVIFKWSIGLAALLAMGQLVLGGVLYTLSAGNIGSQESAKERIKGSITGLILLIACVTLFVAINPSLINLKPINATQDSAAAIKQAKEWGEQNAKAQKETEGLATGAGKAFERNKYNVICKNITEELKKRMDFEKEKLYEQIDPMGQLKAGAKTAGRWVEGIVTLGTSEVTNFVYNAIAGDPGMSLEDALEEAAENKGSNEYMYHCYQDAIIVALGHAQANPDMYFGPILNGYKANNPGLSEYLTADPAGRNSATTDAMGLEFFAQSNDWLPLNVKNQTINSLSNTKIDQAVENMKPLTDIINGNTMMKSIPEETALTAVKYILSYAYKLKGGHPLTDSEYNTFFTKVNTALSK